MFHPRCFTKLGVQFPPTDSLPLRLSSPVPPLVPRLPSPSCLVLSPRCLVSLGVLGNLVEQDIVCVPVCVCVDHIIYQTALSIFFFFLQGYLVFESSINISPRSLEHPRRKKKKKKKIEPHQNRSSKAVRASMLPLVAKTRRRQNSSFIIVKQKALG